MISARKLCPYFQAYTVVVLTYQSFQIPLHQPDTSDRMAKWTLELFEFDLTFHPKPSIMAQVLTDFITECTIPEGESKGSDSMLEDPENQ